jgi:hypothetical protein
MRAQLDFERRGRRRFSVYDGRVAIGAVFESRGIFTAVDASGVLIGAFKTLPAAAAAITPVSSS